jgi:hypothetical protein
MTDQETADLFEYLSLLTWQAIHEDGEAWKALHEWMWYQEEA